MSVTTTTRFEHKALNLKRVAGMSLEDRLNELGEDGYEAVCSAGNYLILKRLKAD